MSVGHRADNFVSDIWITNLLCFFIGLLVAFLFFPSSAHADQPPPPDCGLSLCGAGGDSSCHGEAQGGTAGDCANLILQYRESLDEPPHFDNFVNCSSGITLEFDAEHGHSLLTSCGCGCSNSAPDVDPDEEPECEDSGLVTGGDGRCFFPDPDDGPTDEECQDMGVTVLRSTGNSLEEARAVYIDAQFDPISSGGCSFGSTGRDGGGPTTGAPNSGGTSQGPDLDPTQEGTQNCFFEQTESGPRWSCDNYFESGGSSNGQSDTDGVTQPGPEDSEGGNEATLTNSDGSSTEITNRRDVEQISPGIQQETNVETQTRRDADGNVTGETEIERITLRYDDGSVTTTERRIERDANGNATSTTLSGSSQLGGAPNTDESPQEEENPNTASGIGNCASQPQCDGDEILCQQLLAQWLENCSFENSLQDAIDVANGVSSEGLLEEDVDIDGEVTGFLNAGGFYTSRSCPAPITVNTSIAGSLSLDTQPMCDVAGYLSFILLALAAFVSGRIFLGAF